MTAALSQSAKTAISNVRQAEIESTVAGLKIFLGKSSWVGKNNYYAKDTISRLERATPATPQHKRNLAQYIAASVTLHAKDGWSYLGRAVGCILTGDTHRALHLAYYAELRAAMSLLAGFGIGIFNNQHFIVQQANSATKLCSGQGTHLMAWLALEEWAQMAESRDAFAELIRPDSYSLNQWFQSQGGAIAVAPHAKEWFMQWGMDLRLVTKDRDARNESSYRPDGVPVTWEANAAACLEFVRDMWGLLEPSTTSSFEQIDRHILRLSIEQFYFGSTGKQASSGDSKFEKLIDRFLTGLSLQPSAKRRIKRFLCRQISPADPLVFKYSSRVPSNIWEDSLAVVSRALLLLRLATGTAHRLLENADINADHLAFWWKQLGESCGIWPPGHPPSELHDLWTDVQDSLVELAQVESRDPELFDSFSGIALELARELSVLASHERVAIWSLCPS